jgi:hypothetical protein
MPLDNSLIYIIYIYHDNDNVKACRAYNCLLKSERGCETAKTRVSNSNTTGNTKGSTNQKPRAI